MEEQRQGLTQIYTGNGKGKSTAAFGLALRAVGSGLKVVIIQFMKKGQWYGEINSLSRLAPEIEIHSFGGEKFLKKGAPPDEENIRLAQSALDLAYRVMADPKIDLLILDELNNAIFFDLVSEDAALELMARRPAWQELVITGRNATEKMIAGADLVTEMREIKHPYQRGIGARKGIEF